MENSELKSIAVGVLSTNYWPAHLGLTTDAERIEWLAREVEKLADESVDVDALLERATDAEDNFDEARDEIKEVQECAECGLCDDHKKVTVQ